MYAYCPYRKTRARDNSRPCQNPRLSGLRPLSANAVSQFQMQKVDLPAHLQEVADFPRLQPFRDCAKGLCAIRATQANAVRVLVLTMFPTGRDGTPKDGEREHGAEKG